MSRKITLTRIHAINWYGYRDSFDITGNLLIAGVTGSGKSALMDLIQFVLVAHQRKVRFNLSATGERSTRDLLGYCLGDLKHDVEGARQFIRDKGGITYVALEFTRPNGRQIETWGLRVEFDSSARTEPNRSDGFLIPISLTRADFLHEDRDGKRPLDWSEFKHLVESRGGTIFPTLDSYRREMSLQPHLNFDRSTLDYLLPAAMSFSFMDNFNDFCRRFILPDETVDIQSVKDSYRVFLNLRTELGYLRDQQAQLEVICELDRRRGEAEADHLVCRWLEAEFRRDHARGVWQEAEEGVRNLEKTLTEETQRLQTLDHEIDEAVQLITTTQAGMNELPNGTLFNHVLADNQRLVGLISRLQDVGSKVESALQARANAAKEFVKRAHTLPFSVPEEVLAPVSKAAKHVPQASPASARDVLAELATAITSAVKYVAATIKTKADEFTQLDAQWQNHDRALAALRLGLLQENTVLLGALNARLPRRNSAPAAQALWQLCEVTDEEWRPALEVAFARKFAVVVDPQDYDAAERIYHELREDAPGESLVNSERVMRNAKPAAQGSLAEKLETNHPVARAVVDALFGDVICVKRREQLRQHPRAILNDGFQIGGSFVERRRRYNNRPCIGQRGLEKQQAWLEQQMDDLRARQKLIRPQLEAVEELKTFVAQAHLDSDTVDADLAEAARLPELLKQRDNNLATLKTIRTPDLEAKRDELTALRNREKQLRNERDNLLRKGRQDELNRTRQVAKGAQEALQTFEDKFSEVAAAADVSRHLKRMEGLRAEVGGAFPPKDAAADQFRERAHQADKHATQLRSDLVAARRTLAAVPAYGGHYSNLNPEDADNGSWMHRLEKIRDAEIREYEVKAAAEERNWQELFRVHVLEMLRERLEWVNNQMTLLATQLRDPIGNSRYQIKSRPNRNAEYDLYRKLIDAAAATRGDELLFANVSAEVREEVERLFLKLIEKPDDTAMLAFLDYRTWHEYDMEVVDIRDPDSRPSSLNRHSGKFSGGENQTPYFIAILACYLRAYHRYSRRRNEVALALVPIDEAFSKLSGERIRDCISALKKLDLQGVFSMSSGNIPYAIDQCDQVLSVSLQPELRRGRRVPRNVAVTLTREDALKRFGG